MRGAMESEERQAAGGLGADTAACLPLPSWVRSPVRAFCGVPDKLTLLPHKVPSPLSSTAGGPKPQTSEPQV